MNIRTVFLLIAFLATLIAAYYMNKWLQKVIEPRKNFLRLMIYFLVGFALVLVLSFALVWAIGRVIPAQ